MLVVPSSAGELSDRAAILPPPSLEVASIMLSPVCHALLMLKFNLPHSILICMILDLFYPPEICCQYNYESYTKIIHVHLF